MRRVAVLAMALVTGGVLAGCTTPEPVRTAPVDVPVSADVATLTRAFSPCPGGLADDRADPLATMASAATWRRVVAVTAAEREGASKDEPVGTATLQTTVGSLTVHVHRSFWPGIDWTLQHGGTVDVGVAAPGDYRLADLVLVAVATTPSGTVFFPGECQEAALRRPLTGRFGDGLDAALRGLSGEPISAVRARLVPSRTPTATSAANRVLAPGDAPAELLASLHPLGVEIVLAGALGPDRTVCTRIAAGWNECVAATGEVNGYLDDSGRLEVWLLDGAADVTRPVRRLGVVTLPPGTTSARLRVQVSGGAASDTDGVRVLTARP